MRIAIVSRIYRPEPAAASFFLGAVSDALGARGHDVDVLTVAPPPGLGTGSRGERVRTFPVLRDASGYVRGYLQYLSFDLPLAFRLLTLRRPDAVFVEPPPTTGAVVRVICALRRIPYVYDTADIWSDAASQATDSSAVVRILRWIERFAMRGATNMVTISQGVVDRVRALGVSSPMSVTGFGADTSVFRYSETDTEPVFIYAGTYTGLHGADVLIEAFAQFTATHSGYRLRFIGNGTEQEPMRARAAELGIEDAVEFLGAVPAAELQPQLSAALCSLATLNPDGGYEYAFTSKIYSSLASGCPAIFSGPGPTAPFLHEASLHVRAGEAVDYDPAEIANAMRRIADRPPTPAERRQISDWASEEHSMAAVAGRVADVIIAAGNAGNAGRSRA